MNEQNNGNKQNDKYDKYFYRSVIVLGCIIYVVIIWALYLKFTKDIPFTKTLWEAGDILSFVGTVILGFIVFFQEKRYQESEQRHRESERRKETAEKKAKIKKSALIIYFDFKFAFQDLLPCYTYLSNSKRQYGKFYFDTDLWKAAPKFIYLDENWIPNVANLVDNENPDMKLIEQIYDMYGHLNDVNKVLMGQITDEVSILSVLESDRSCYNMLPGATLKPEKIELLGRLAKMAGINHQL